jgi:O-antigen ligase
MMSVIGTLGAVVLGLALGVASFGMAFAIGMRRAVLAVLLVRSSCDPLFGLTQAEGGGMGLGAAMNALVIVLALLFYLESPVLIGSAILPWTGFLMAGLASMISSPEPFMKAFREFLVITSYAAVFALPFALIRSREWALRCLTVVMCSSIIPIAYAFFQLASTTDGIRVSGTFTHPNIFAFYLVGLFALTLFLLRSSLVSLSPRIRGWLVLYLSVIIILLLLTGTRSAWIGGAIILIVYASVVDKRYLLCLPLVLLTIYLPGVAERLSDLQTGNLDYGYAQLNSYAWRKILWQSALDWLMENRSEYLVLGYGFGSFEYYQPLFFPRAVDPVGAHNALLQIFFEMGILGLLGFLWLFVSLFAKLRIGCPFDKGGAIIMMALALAYLVVCYSDNMLGYLVFQWYFWFVMGVVCAWYQLQSTPQPVHTSTARGLNLGAKHRGAYRLARFD